MKKDNRKPIEVNRKPTKCPVCGGKVVPINYGEPDYETFQASERGEIVLGGCLIGANAPDWACVKCGAQFLKVKK
jgi:DNA-directed RNA polymerase subunit RPC12/RpoP